MIFETIAIRIGQNMDSPVISKSEKLAVRGESQIIQIRKSQRQLLKGESGHEHMDFRLVSGSCDKCDGKGEQSSAKKGKHVEECFGKASKHNLKWTLPASPLAPQKFRHCFSSSPHLELFINAADVGMHGLVTYAELLGNFLVKKSLAQAVQDFLFTL